jgi:tetratricopeptide (TPR) repeat protein
MLPRLQQRLTLLTTGARTLPDRQRTLRNAIAWSHDLLDAAERRLFARAKALTGAGGIAWWQEDIAAARGFYEEALAIEGELGNPARIAEALYNQAFIAGAGGDFDAAVRLFEESLELFRLAGDELGVTRVLWMIVIRDLAAGNWERPLANAEEAVATWRRAGDRFHLADALVWQAAVYARAGRPADARSAVLEALELFRAVDSAMGILSVVLSLSYLARWEDRYEDALRLAGAAESLREQVGGRAPLDYLAGFLGNPEAEARAHLPEEAAQRAFQEGRTMSADEALAHAAGGPPVRGVPGVTGPG